MYTALDDEGSYIAGVFDGRIVRFILINRLSIWGSCSN